MTGKVRGLQLFRQLCRNHKQNSSCTTQPPSIASQSNLLPQFARAFAAQPAPDLASETSHLAAPERTERRIEHQAHQQLYNALSAALTEAHAGPRSEGERGVSHKRATNRILREFAPLKLILTSNNDEQSKENLAVLEKWEQQLKLEWSTVERLRSKYSEQATKMRKMGRGSMLGGTNSIMAEWFPALRDAIAEEQEAVRLIVCLASSLLT